MQDLISRQAAIDALKGHRALFCDNTPDTFSKLSYGEKCRVDELDTAISTLVDLPPAQRTQTDTSNSLKALDCVERQAAIDAANDLLLACLKIQKQDRSCGLIRRLEDLPSAQSEWDNHTVACLLADLFGDSCACNYNGIDEWLPEKCEVIDACPNPVGVACWEQYLKHRAERREE